MNKRRRYSDEFKLDAIRLVKEHQYNCAEAARNLGIDRGMLARWISEQEARSSELNSGGVSDFLCKRGLRVMPHRDGFDLRTGW